jgi:hypothetical protein
LESLDPVSIIFATAVGLGRKCRYLVTADQAIVYNTANYDFTAINTLSGSSGSYFGYTLAVAGTYLVVGAPSDSSGNGAGAVYVYANSGNNIYTLNGSAVHGDTNSLSFGGAVAAYGNLFAVGSFNTQSKQFDKLDCIPSSVMCDSTCFSGGFGYVGVVYIYKFTGNTLLQMVTVRQSASTAQYAGSMSMGNNVLVVGDLTYNSNTGTVFVLVNQDANENGASWNFTVSQMLTVSGLTVSSQFGKSVSLVGNYLAVGTPGQRKLRIRHC